MYSCACYVPGQDLKNIHNETVKDVPVTRTKSIEAVKNDQLGIVVRFPCDQVDIARCSSYPLR